MMPLDFDPVLFTGVDEIDAQHRELFDRIGRLLEASRHRRSREEVVRLLEFLGAYVVEHFAA
ncbi:MAG TPA: hemerythrin domain-containing protein, partial [Anaeromyxobacter sp.]